MKIDWMNCGLRWGLVRLRRGDQRDGYSPFQARDFFNHCCSCIKESMNAFYLKPKIQHQDNIWYISSHPITRIDRHLRSPGIESGHDIFHPPPHFL
jgi:hypothetical protein